MDPHTAAPRLPDPEAVDFVRFCYRRRRVGWPELYDEMCAVAARGLFRGYDADDLGAHGVGFALFDMPGLAALTHRIVDEEKALRRPVTVVITDAEPVAYAAPDRSADLDFDVEIRPMVERVVEPDRGAPRQRFAIPVAAGA